MDAEELAFRELLATKPVTRPQVMIVSTSGVVRDNWVRDRLVPDPTEGLPLFVNVGSPSTDEALERMFAQENGG